jgi:Flp pilus assembly protein TadG
VVEFALVAPLAVAVALAVAQLALFLYERNVVMGSLSEGARIAAVEGRTAADGERSVRELLQQSLGGRVASAVPVRGTVENGLVVLRANGVLPSFVPLVPGLSVSMTASMHKEERLRQDQLRAGGVGLQGALAGEASAGNASAGNAGGGP